MELKAGSHGVQVFIAGGLCVRWVARFDARCVGM